MNILLLGACDSGNLGDPVICDCVASWLRSHFPVARVTVRDLYRRESRHTAAEPNRKDLHTAQAKQRIIRAATAVGIDLTCHFEQRRVEHSRDYIDATCAGDYDAVVFAGGQMFMDRYALFLEAHVRRFQERNIPVFFNACGTGPARSLKIARRLKQTLESSCVKFVSCRDNAALVAPCLETFDPALSASQVYGISRGENADTIGLGVICNHAAPEKEQTRFWQKLVRELERRGLKWQFFTNGDPADMAYARTVLASMPELAGREAELLHPRDTEPESLARTIAGYRGILAFRLHSHILAVSLGVPSVALVWDEKLPFFFEKIGHPERCFRMGTGVEAILAALDRAEKEGYDRGLLDAQAKAAREQLIGAMIREVPGLREVAP